MCLFSSQFCLLLSIELWCLILLSIHIVLCWIKGRYLTLEFILEIKKVRFELLVRLVVFILKTAKIFVQLFKLFLLKHFDSHNAVFISFKNRPQVGRDVLYHSERKVVIYVLVSS